LERKTNKSDGEFVTKVLHFCPTAKCFTHPKKSHVAERKMPTLHAKSLILIDPTIVLTPSDDQYLRGLELIEAQ